MMFRLKAVRKVLFIVCFLFSVLLTPSFETEAQAQTTEWLPKVLIVTSTVEPQRARARHLWTDLFEYGITANVSSTSTYNSMNRSNYDIIIFSGYSNPVDPEDMYLNMLTDVNAGRKLLFMNHYPFMQIDQNWEILKTYYRLGIVDMPEDFPSGRFDEPSELSLGGNPGDSYLKDADLSLSYAYFFSTLPGSAIGWVKDETSGRFFAIFTDKGGWIGEYSCTALHMGKVVAKIWWGKTDKSFGFSMNVMYGAPVFLWRVDADRSKEEAPLNWLGDLATLHSLKFSIGARGERITSDIIAGYWRNLATNELVEIGVHTFTHQSPISTRNITHEVIDTYDLMLSYDIPTEKFFLGWGTSDWSWQQIKTLFNYGWTIIHSSREHIFVDDTYNINTIANFTVAPPLLGLTGRADWNAYNDNFNFTKANISYFQKRKDAHLPFLLLTHDYIIHNESYYNDYGPLKDQIEAFFDWLGSQGVYSVWITEYYDFFQDTFRTMITRSNNTFSVTRPKAKANFVKIFVGNNHTYAVGTSVLTQKILDGWLYVTLKPETTSTFTLKTGVNPVPNVFASTSTIISTSFVSQRLDITLAGVINTTGQVKVHDSWSGNLRWAKSSDGTVVNLFRQDDGITNINVKFAREKIQLTFGRGLSFYGEDAVWADRTWDYTSLSYNATSKTLLVFLNSTFDEVSITGGGVSSDHSQVGSTQTVWFKAEYEYDSERFDDTQGMLYLDGESMTWSEANLRWEYAVTSSTLGPKTFKVTSVENLYYIKCSGLGRPTSVGNDHVLSFNETDGMTKIMVKGEKLAVSWTEGEIDLKDSELVAINDFVGEKAVIWDEIEIAGIDADTSAWGVLKLRAKINYAYTKDPVASAVVTVNGIKFAETEPGTYTGEIHDWNPFQSLRIKVNLPSFTETVENMSITHTMNLLLLFFLVICALTIVGGTAVYHIRKVKRHKGHTQRESEVRKERNVHFQGTFDNRKGLCE